jgi:cytochrome P450
MNILPQITAQKAYQARKILQPAFLEYYNKGLDRNANAFIKGRAKAARVENFSNKDLAGFEITICFASLTNTVPNAFSMLCNVLSDPDLTAEIREEVAGVATRSTIDGKTQILLDITSVNTKCPTLVSAFHETLRTCVNATPVRVVTDDMMLKDTYFLKKGGVIQIIGGAIHESQEIWGDDVNTFNGRRFMKKKGLTKQQKKAQTQGLLPFGGGKHLCPGRHLAFTEIVSFVALVVYGFEVQLEGGGLLKLPPYKTAQLGENSKKPVYDLEVLIKRREEYKGVTWGFSVDPTMDIEKVSAV